MIIVILGEVLIDYCICLSNFLTSTGIVRSKITQHFHLYQQLKNHYVKNDSY